MASRPMLKPQALYCFVTAILANTLSATGSNIALEHTALLWRKQRKSLAVTGKCYLLSSLSPIGQYMVT